ncbi:hypothetical protein EG835_03705, partial [bacterium]|nr:hypothetical protein [bacterium]
MADREKRDSGRAETGERRPVGRGGREDEGRRRRGADGRALGLSRDRVPLVQSLGGGRRGLR